MQQACERCWKRKQRCDKQLPQCSVCRNANARCLPRRQGVVYDPEEPGTWSYVESLEQRVARLQEAARTQQYSEHAEEGTPSAASPSDSVSDVNPESGSHGGGDGSSRADPAVLSYAFRQAARLPLSAMGEQHPESAGTTTMRSITLGSLFQAASSVSGENPRTAKCESSEPDSLHASRALQEHSRGLRPSPTPQEDTVVKEALSRCAKFLSAFLPFIDLTCLESMRTMMQNEPPLHAQVLVHFAVAIGLMQYPSTRHIESVALHLAEYGMSLMPELLASDVAEVPILRCLLALTVITTLIPQSGSTWHIFGLALSRYMTSDLHAEALMRERSTVDPEMDGSNIAQCMYIFDTSVIGVALNRPFALDDEEISKFLHTPSSIPAEHTPFLECHIQHANLFREVRECMDLEFEYHVLNWRHWRASASSIFATGTQDTMTGLRERHLGRLSCNLLIAILVHRRRNAQPDGDLNTWFPVLIDEFSRYTTILSREVLGSSTTLSSFDICDIFNLAVVATDLKLRYQEQPHQIALTQFPDTCNSMVQTCIQLLSAGGVRFAFSRQLCDLLIQYLRLLEAKSFGSIEQFEDILAHNHDLVGARIQRYMKTLFA